MSTSSGWRCSSNAPGIERACTAVGPGDNNSANLIRAATERTIALLEERRSALIAAAVTGQTVVASEPSRRGAA